MLKFIYTRTLIAVLIILLSPFKSFSSQIDSVNVWRKKADSLSALNDSSSINYFKLLIDVNEDIAEQQHYHYSLGTIYFKKEAYNEAIKNFLISARLAEQMGNNINLAVSYNNLGIIYFKTSQISKGLSYLQLATDEYAKSNDEDRHATSLLNLGIAYKKISLYEKASQNLYQAIQILESKAPSIGLASAYNSLANIGFDTGDTLNTLILFKKSLEIRKKINHDKGIAGSLNNIGNYYKSIDQLDSAKFYFEQSLRIKQQLKDTSSAAITLTNIADIYVLQKNYKDAIDIFSKNIILAEEHSNYEETSENATKLAQVYLATNNLSLAQVYQEKGERAAKKINNLDLLKKNLEVKIELFQKKKLFKEALKTALDFNNLKDEILSIERNKALTEMQIKYEVEQQKKENKLLQEETKRQQAQLETEEFKNILSGVVIAALLILSSILFYVFRQRSKHNKLLEGLLNEQQHRVKNFLQTIGGIFRMHARKAEHEEVKAAVKEGSDRLEAMTLIHNQLNRPSVDAPVSVNFTEFAQKLIKHISTAYAGNNDIITPELKLDDINLDVNKAVALGLILNEVVNNAFKYAVPNNPDPKIQIELQREEIDGKESVHLSIADNGPGLPQDKKKFRKGSLGMNLIKLFSKNLNGDFDFTSNQGTHFNIKFYV